MGCVRRARRRTLDSIDFFVYSRAAPGAARVEHDPSLDEEHWSYMDGFADGMTARGPTLAGRSRAVDRQSPHRRPAERGSGSRVRRARAVQRRRPVRRAHHPPLREPARPDDVGVSGRVYRPPLPRDRAARAGAGEQEPALLRPDLEARLRERLIVHGDLLSLDDAATGRVSRWRSRHRPREPSTPS